MMAPIFRSHDRDNNLNKGNSIEMKCFCSLIWFVIVFICVNRDEDRDYFGDVA